MTQEEKNRIIAVLNQRGARLPCPRCGQQNFSILDGYFTNPLQANVGDLVLGGAAIPTVVIACGNCGFLSQHAIGALGLLPAQGNETQG